MVANSTRLYLSDRYCPLGNGDNYEPAGDHFLSPCLYEADLMGRVFDDKEKYAQWLKGFLPELFKGLRLEPGMV